MIERLKTKGYIVEGAVPQLTRSFVAEWARRGVRVHAVAPTYIATPFNAFADKQGKMSKRWVEGTPHGRLDSPKR